MRVTPSLLLLMFLFPAPAHSQAGSSSAAGSARVAVVTGFDVPESARYDPDRDVYYVSNVTGRPTDADNTGFISRVTPDGRVVDLKWIAGGANGVTLNGPKGIALAGGILAVADITVVRRFDRETGRQLSVIDLAPLGATFLNDVAAGPAGSLFVSDTGFVFGPTGGPSLSGPQRIYRIDASGAASVVVEGRELEAPNGVFWDEPRARLLIASLAGKNVFEWTTTGGLRIAASGPGGYDGIERLADGRLLVSSQDGASVLAINGSAMEPVVTGVGDTADIGVDLKRNRVAIPRLDNNTVEIWQLRGAVPTVSSAPPAPSMTGRLVYDEGRKQVLLFDAIATPTPPTGSDAVRQWSWDGRAWTLLPGSGPSSRVVTAAAYDASRRRTVMYGGAAIPSRPASLSDTWETDGATWTEVQQDRESVQPRDHHAMAYDAARGNTVLFGGGTFAAGKPYIRPGDTWTWDGSRWTRAAEDGPAGRGLPGLVYDSRRQNIVLFGGNGARPGPDLPFTFFNDTWIWNGSVWKKAADAGPPARYGHAMAFDSRAGVAWLYGGSTEDRQFEDMWKWDGRRWSEVRLSGPTPGPRYGAAMAYDSARDRTVLVGGRAGDKSTWEWNGQRWSEINAVAEPQPVTVVDKPLVTVPHLAARPELSDFLSMRPAGAAAQSMARVEGFVTRQPIDGQTPRQNTVAYLGYTDDALHVVFAAFDSEPGKVQAHLVRREDIFSVSDDLVELRIDTFNERRESYYFGVNPLGVQVDASWPEVGGDYDQSFDMVWQSKGQRTAEGYVVSISIPFRSVRFPADDVQTWGIYLGRFVGRSGEWSLWPQISSTQQSLLAQMAGLTGIRGARTPRNGQLIPYASYRGFKALDRRDPLAPRFVVDKLDPAVGVDAKVVVKERFVIDIAANPDFSQVESDAPQITANQRFELFFPEKRPFFLENSGYFQTPTTLVFTRRLADPSFGARVTGKASGWTIGVLAANDQAPGRRVADTDPASGDDAWAAVGRVTRDLGTQSSLGVLSTVRRLRGETNTVVSADARVRVSKTLTFTTQGSLSTVTGGKRGNLFQATLSNTNRTLTWRTNFLVRSPEFRADLGFIPRVDIRYGTHSMSYRRFRKGILQSWGPDLLLTRTWAYDGTALEHLVQPGVSFDLARQTKISASYSSGAQGFRAGELANLPTFRSFNTSTWTVEASTLPQRWLTFEAALSGGRAMNFSPAGMAAPETGAVSSLGLGAGLRPSTSVRADSTYLRTVLSMPSDSRRIFASQILRERVSWQISREWSARAIIQRDWTHTDASLTSLTPRRNINFDVLVTRLLNPSTALYVGFNTNAQNLSVESTAFGSRVVLRDSGLTPDARQLFVKVSYLLR